MNKSNIIFKSTKDTLTFFGKESNKIAYIINQRISNRSIVWKNIKQKLYDILDNFYNDDCVIYVEQHSLNLIISLANYYKINYTI